MLALTGPEPAGLCDQPAVGWLSEVAAGVVDEHLEVDRDRLTAWLGHQQVDGDVGAFGVEACGRRRGCRGWRGRGS